jgi:hypothetical protein
MHRLFGRKVEAKLNMAARFAEPDHITDHHGPSCSSGFPRNRCHCRLVGRMDNEGWRIWPRRTDNQRDRWRDHLAVRHCSAQTSSLALAAADNTVCKKGYLGQVSKRCLLHSKLFHQWAGQIIGRCPSQCASGLFLAWIPASSGRIITLLSTPNCAEEPG